MYQLLTTAPNSEIIASIERNVESAFWTAASSYPGAELIKTAELCRFLTPVMFPMGNIVVKTALKKETVDQVVEEVLADYKQRDLPMMWFEGPNSRPKNLGAVLEAAGCTRLFESPGMAANLAETVEGDEFPTGIRVEEVRNDALLEEWSETLSAAFNLSQEVVGLFTCVPKKHGFGVNAPFRLFVAYLDGIPASVSALHLAEGVAGIYCVGSRPEAQRRGLGRAISLRPMLEAKKLGYHLAVLQSSAAGLKVYERLGFQEYCRFQRYAFNLSAIKS